MPHKVLDRGPSRCRPLQGCRCLCKLHKDCTTHVSSKGERLGAFGSLKMFHQHSLGICWVSQPCAPGLT